MPWSFLVGGYMANQENHAKLTHHCVFPSVIRLREHMESKHNIVKSYECNQCGKMFAFKHAMEYHVLKDFNCNVFEKVFNRQKNLTQHKACHEEPQCVCQTCVKRFRCRCVLNRHMKGICSGHICDAFEYIRMQLEHK